MKKYYFQFISLLLLVFSLIAFSDNLFTDIDQESNSDPVFAIHGLLMLFWFVLYAMQSNFILTGNRKRHISWGLAGMLLAVGVFVSTVVLFVHVFKGWSAIEHFVLYNRLAMLSFAVFVVLAYLNRYHPARHKRFTFMSTVLILEPIFGRATEHLYIDQWEAFYVVAWNLLFLSLLVYDWATLKKIHTISWTGYLLFYILWGLAIVLAPA